MSAKANRVVQSEILPQLNHLTPHQLKRLALVTTLIVEHPLSLGTLNQGNDSLLDVLRRSLEILPDQSGSRR